MCFGNPHHATRPEDIQIQKEHQGLLANYLSTLLLTLSNPMTIIAFTGIFAGLGLAQNQEDYTGALKLVLGLFAGSVSWWLILSQGVGKFLIIDSPEWMARINRLAGIMIFLFGILALISLPML